MKTAERKPCLKLRSKRSTIDGVTRPDLVVTAEGKLLVGQKEVPADEAPPHDAVDLLGRSRGLGGFTIERFRVAYSQHVIRRIRRGGEHWWEVES